jgi:hypothetical protein
MNETPAPAASAWQKFVRFGQALRPLLPWVCILFPVLFLARLIWEYKVNIPFLDDFMFTDMLEKSRQGFRWTFDHSDTYLTLHDFFMAQMEHRLALVRALILLRDHFWPTNITVENWFSFALLCGTALNVSYLLRKTAGAFHQWWPVMALACFAIFSPIQYQIILWPMMFQVAFPTFFLSTTLVALQSDLPLWLRWLIGIACAVGATLCIASGMLVWVLPVFVMLFGGIMSPRARVAFVTAWAVVFCGTVALYFHNLHNEVEGPFAYKQKEEETMHRNISSFVESPEKVIPFVCRVVGGHLARGSSVSLMESAYWIGFVSLLLFAGAFGWWLYRFRDEAFRRRLSPWIAFGSYSVATALLVCLGRLWATSTGDNSISPRYTIHGVPLAISLCAMAWIISSDLLQRHAAWKPRIEKGLFAGGFVLAALLALSWVQGARLMDSWSSARLRMATNTMFFKIHFLDNGPDIEGNIAANFRRARGLDDIHVLKPAMLTDNRLNNFKISKSALNKNSAQWENLTVDAQKLTARATGYAALGGRKRVADGVLFTYKAGKEWRVFHVGQVSSMPLFMDKTLGRDLQNIHTPGNNAGENFAAFTAEFKLDRLPPGVHDVAAWAFDYREQTAYPIVGAFRLDTEKKTAMALPVEKQPALEAQAK